MNIINSNINTININNINSITSLTDINNILKTAQNQKIKILDSFWEALYKDKCPKYFMPLSKVVSELEFWAINFHDNMNELKIASFLNDYHNTLYPIYIPDILELYRKYGFKELQYYLEFRNMICEACACKDCPSMEKYLHRTCAECKKNYYKMYAGYCGECDN